MRKKPSFLAVLLAGAFVGSLIGRVLADAGVQLTLIASSAQTIDAALADKQPGPPTQNVYIGQTASITNMAYNVFARNPGLWIGTNVDLTAVAAYNNGGDSWGQKFEITAISPIHCIGAAHAAAKVGEVFNFVGADNTTVTRTVVASLNPVDDIEVYLLNQELPASVTPMRMLPRNWTDYLRPGTALHLPAIFINQNNRLFCAEAYGIAPGPNPQVIYQAPTTRQRLAFNTQVISGDSSFPQIVLVNGTAAILSCWHYGGFGAGPLDCAHFDAINMAMRQLSKKFSIESNYQLRPVNMQGIAKL